MGPLTSAGGSGSSSPTPGGGSSLPSQQLGQQAFLQLLVTQLKYQDPLHPMSNEAFIAEMAQFQSLDDLNQIQSEISQALSGTETVEALSLVGKSVQLLDAKGNRVSGVVTGVAFAKGVPQIVVNGSPYDLSTLSSVDNG